MSPDRIITDPQFEVPKDDVLDQYWFDKFSQPSPVSMDSQQNHNLQGVPKDITKSVQQDFAVHCPVVEIPLETGPDTQYLLNNSLINHDDYWPDGTNAEAMMRDLEIPRGSYSYNNNTNIDWASPLSSEDLTAVAPGDVIPKGRYNVMQNVDQIEEEPSSSLGVQQDVIHNSQLVLSGAPSSQGTLNDRPASPSGARLDDGVPPINSWPGIYEFGCSVVGATTTKCAYSMERNKLYVKKKVETEFLFCYNFEKVKTKGSEMLVEAFVRYEKPDAAKTPVNRCSHHTELDKQALKETNKGRENIKEKLELIPHFLKCTHNGAHHFQDENLRQRVRVPLGQPQPGSDHVSRNFKFDCRTSCSKVAFPQKSQSYPMVLVYELKEKKPNQEMLETVGREIFNLKVCSYPKRDIKRDEKKDENSSGKRKLHTPATSGRRLNMEAAAEEDLGRPAKKFRMDIKIEEDFLEPYNSGERAPLNEKAPQDAEEDKLIEQIRYVLRVSNRSRSRKLSLIRSSLTMNIECAYEMTKDMYQGHDQGPGPSPK